MYLHKFVYIIFSYRDGQSLNWFYYNIKCIVNSVYVQIINYKFYIYIKDDYIQNILGAIKWMLFLQSEFCTFDNTITTNVYAFIL